MLSVRTYVNAYSAPVGLIALLNMQFMKQNAECVMPIAKYIGMSNRPLSERIKEHEPRYTRLPTGESPIGDHYREHWLNGDPVPILSEKPSINNLLTSYSLKIIDVE